VGACWCLRNAGKSNLRDDDAGLWFSRPDAEETLSNGLFGACRPTEIHPNTDPDSAALTRPPGAATGER